MSRCKRVLRDLVLGNAFLFGFPAYAAPKEKPAPVKEETGTTVINHDLVKQLKTYLKQAEAGEIYQMFIVTTGKKGVSFSYNTTKEGELILIGGVDWAKTHLVSDFDKRQGENK